MGKIVLRFMSLMKCLLIALWSVLLSADAYRDLDAHMRKSLAGGKVIGTAVAVVEGDKITFMKAYGVKKRGAKDPVDMDSVFQLGSLSKSVTATLTAVLQKNKLVDARLPSNRQILSHTTGYKRPGWNSRIEGGWSRSLLLKNLSQSEREQPGKFDYHNLAFSLIEDVIERATQSELKDAFKHYLFKPAGMKRASVGFEDFIEQANRTWPHVKTKRGCVACKTYSKRYHEVVPSAGGINASIQDMARFIQLQMGAFPSLVSSKELKQFHEPVTSASDAIRWLRKVPHSGPIKSYYGLGWRIADINGERVVFHSGWLKGFTNFMAFIPERKIGIVVLTNSESGFSSQTAMRFLLGKRYS